MAAKQKIAPLTSLRFFAAFLVVLFHSAPAVVTENPYVPVKNLISIGFICVSFFFTLSGYILAVVYLRSDTAIDRKRFWMTRFARIYPLFLLSLFLDLPNLLLFRIAKYGWKAAVLKSSVTLAGNVLMLQAWTEKLHSLNDPVWSLSVETFFYLLFPLTGWWLWRLSARGSLATAAIIYIAGMAAVAAALHFHLHETTIKFNPLFHLHEFFAGILIAKWHTLQLAKPEAQRTLQRVSPWIAILSLLLFGAAVFEFNRIHVPYLQDGMLMPVYALAIVAFGSGNRLIDRLFSVSWLVVPGEASYGLYLIHWPVKTYWERAGLNLHPTLYPIYLLLVVGASVVIFYRFEAPSRKAILQSVRVRSKETVIASSIAQ
jgi:peptidoglycan/LPS O-acetylase OafA/YrhL